MLKTFSENTQGTDFFVGDIHGCWNDLQAALARVKFDKKVDRLFCVGDLIDRGPRSRRCLNLVHEPWFHSVIGNHEVMMQVALERGDPSLWYSNGGWWAAEEDPAELKRMCMDCLSKMPLAIEVEVAGGKRIGVIHADVSSGLWGKFHYDVDMWSRSRIRSVIPTPLVEGIDAVVVGHTIVKEPRVRANVVYIDTGSFVSHDITLLSSLEVLNMVK